MKIKPVKHSKAPGYPEKHTEEAKQALLKTQRWLGAPLAVGIISATVAASAQIPEKAYIPLNTGHSIINETPALPPEWPIMGDLPMPTPTPPEWPTMGVPPMPTPVYDLNGDGLIDIDDLTLMLSSENYGSYFSINDVKSLLEAAYLQQKKM